MSDQWLKALSYLAGGRKVTFGAIIGGFFGACIYALVPGVVGQLGNRYFFIFGCSLFGAACHRGVEMLVKFVFPILTGFVSHYESLAELRRHYLLGHLSREKYLELVEKVIERRFLGSSEKKQLPPGS